VIGLLSGKGSPGVTTAALALALAWPQPPPTDTSPDATVVMVDADPAGCGTVPGFLRGAVPEGAGLPGLMPSAERVIRAEEVASVAVALDETQQRLLVPGAADALRTKAVTPVWPGLARTLTDLSGGGVTVLVDAGRLGTTDTLTPLLGVADVLVVVARSSLLSVTGARSAIRQLRQSTAPACRSRRVVVLVVGPDRPYPAGEIARSLAVPVVGTLAWDPAAAPVLSDGEPANWRFSRSPLLRSARAAAVRLNALTEPEPRAGETAAAVAGQEAGVATGPGDGSGIQVRSEPGDGRPASVRSVAAHE
jgi:hypothetical protein